MLDSQSSVSDVKINLQMVIKLLYAIVEYWIIILMSKLRVYFSQIYELLNYR